MSVTVSEYEPTDALVEWLERQWGEPTVEWHGEVFHPRELEGFVAHRDRAIGGVLTYVDYPDRLHIVSLDASQRRQGIGSILVARVFREAIARGKSRITLTVTNDNLDALAFFQYHGFQLTAFRKGAALGRDASAAAPTKRAGSPVDPLESILSRDELDMEYVLPEDATDT